jgi:uncharacterized surface protein with fasciclin (FAS1) repeats
MDKDMHIFNAIRYWSKQLNGIQMPVITRLLVLWIILTSVFTSCESDPYESNWDDMESLTISQYLEKNQEEYSKFYRLLIEGKMLGALYAYNPYGEGYTLFLPTDKAIDHFIGQNQDYGSFEELIKDTSFIKMLTRYHTLKRKVKSDEFPDGALNDLTLTGDRLIFGFNTDGNNQIIKVNNSAPIIKSNLKMTNGYIHIISEVLEKAKLSGYDWLQQQDDYSILAQAVRLSGLRSRLWWEKYTILAEHDTIYNRSGIHTVEDLIAHIATPGMALSNRDNKFYQFAAYHFVGGEFYMNDFNWGNYNYTTLASKPLTISVGVDIKFNPGVDTYGFKISDSGDAYEIDYISPIWENCNIFTRSGPVHSISDMLFYEPFPKK